MLSKPCQKAQNNTEIGWPQQQDLWSLLDGDMESLFSVSHKDGHHALQYISTAANGPRAESEDGYSGRCCPCVQDSSRRSVSKQVTTIRPQNGCYMLERIGSQPQSGGLQTTGHVALSVQPLLLQCWQISSRRNPAWHKTSKSCEAAEMIQQLSRTARMDNIQQT